MKSVKYNFIFLIFIFTISSVIKSYRTNWPVCYFNYIIKSNIFFSLYFMNRKNFQDTLFSAFNWFQLQFRIIPFCACQAHKLFKQQLNEIFFFPWNTIKVSCRRIQFNFMFWKTSRSGVSNTRNRKLCLWGTLCHHKPMECNVDVLTILQAL